MNIIFTSQMYWMVNNNGTYALVNSRFEKKEGYAYNLSWYRKLCKDSGLKLNKLPTHKYSLVSWGKVS